MDTTEVYSAINITKAQGAEKSRVESSIVEHSTIWYEGAQIQLVKL